MKTIHAKLKISTTNPYNQSAITKTEISQALSTQNTLHFKTDIAESNDNMQFNK